MSGGNGFATLSATEIATGVRSGAFTAVAVTQAAISRIAAGNPTLNAFTAVTADRALAQAVRVDEAVAQGRDPGPLAGVPFAVKNLFDIEGVVTLAGSRINRGHAPAARDALLAARLEAAGGVLAGALNMGEYAYDFTGENAHDGPSRNPHDPAHMSGGSSGGSGTAVASGMVPLALGSDTNGSIRVPSAFCGLFGLKPTYGRLPRTGTFPFVSSLDHLGPMARSVADLALSFDAMQGGDAGDPACADQPDCHAMAALSNGIGGLRVAVAGGHFSQGGLPQAHGAVARVAEALSTAMVVDVPDAKAARAAAYLITMSEGAALHLDRLKMRAADFDPDVRDRLIAGAMIPAAWVARAQKLRRAWRARVLALFEHIDVLLAPSTPCPAPLIGQKTMTLAGVTMPLRPNIGLFTQPISFIGLPVVGVPVWLEDERLPMGVQVIAAPWREDIALRVAHWLELNGVCSAPVAHAGVNHG
jgi:1-carboxybiuret hydrolase